METPPKRRIRVCNTSLLIKDTICNGCDYLEVLDRRTRYGDSEHYYCNKCGLHIEPRNMTKEACDEIRKLRNYRSE